MIEIYGKPQCPFCDMAKALCENKSIPYTYKQLNEDFTRDDLMVRFPNARTFPQIILDGEAIGGFDNLKDMIA